MVMYAIYALFNGLRASRADGKYLLPAMRPGSPPSLEPLVSKLEKLFVLPLQQSPKDFIE